MRFVGPRMNRSSVPTLLFAVSLAGAALIPPERVTADVLAGTNESALVRPPQVEQQAQGDGSVIGLQYADPAEQMETFMTNQLVPWIKANLVISGTEQIWLLGFSKSGVGAQDLILKHPGVYTLAASWDFPDSNAYDALGTSEATGYGTNANFLANYQLSQSFVNTYAAPFTAHKRIWIGGYQYFQWETYNDYGVYLTNAGVQYDAETPTQMAHRWDSGWVPGALAALYQDSINLH